MRMPREDKQLAQSEKAMVLDRTVSLTAAEASARGPVPPEPGTAQARYTIDREVARGGIGRILKARDHDLDRDVAIKELLSSTSAHRVRFQREAAITGQLQHPAIVPIYDVGEWSNGSPFYVMKLLSGGRTLKQAIGDAPSVDDRLALLPSVIAIADAVAYAHSVGIVHRDLKPSNVLLGPFGETIVIDWGLAKQLSASPDAVELPEGPYRQCDPDLTAAGSIVGTPHYMPPEQARGERVGMHADVYALGAILYHLLSGRPPYAGGMTTTDVMRSLLEAAPVPVDTQESGIPQELGTIVRKAMARTLSERYSSASQLAEDLKRFQTGQLVGAHQYSRRALVARWLRRNRRLASVASVLMLLLAVTATVSVRRIVRERNIARERSNDLILEQAKSSLVSDPSSAIAWLKLYRGSEPEQAAAVAANAAFRGVARHVLQHSLRISRVVFSADGKTLAAGGNENVVRLWDVASGRQLRALPFREVYALATAPDARTLAAAGGEEGDIRVWDLASGQVRDLKHDRAMIADLQFLDGGQGLLSLGEDGSLHLWNISTGSDRRLPLATAVAVGPDGHHFVSVGADHSVTIYASDGQEASLVGRHEGPARYVMWAGKTIVAAGDRAITVFDIEHRRSRALPPVGKLAHSDVELHPSAALSADGTWLAVVTRSKDLHTWNLEDGIHHSMALGVSLPSILRFAPRGTKLAVGDTRGLVRILDVKRGSLRELRGQANSIEWLDFSPTQSLLASASNDKTIRLWPLEDQSERLLGDSDATIQNVRYSPDSKTLAATDASGQIMVWNELTGESVRLEGHRTVVRELGFSSDGARLVSASWDKTVRIWNIADDSRKQLRIELPGVAERALFLPGDRQVALAADGAVYLADAKDGSLRRIGVHRPHSAISSLRLSPVAPEIATAGADGTIHVIRLDRTEEHIFRGHTGPVYRAEYSPDGKQLLSASADGSVRLWTLADGSQRVLRKQSASVAMALFVLDDHHVAIPVANGMDIIDIEDGHSRTLTGHDQKTMRLLASPDRKLLASSSRDGTVRLWQLGTGYTAMIGLPGGDASAMAFSHDGRRLAIGDSQGEVREFDVGAIRFVPDGKGERFARWLDGATSLTVEDRQFH